MFYLSRLFLLLMVAVVLTGCDSTSSSDDPVSAEDFVGSWKASSHMFTNNANSSQVVDIIALGGETRMTVLAGGGARTWVDFGDFHDEWDAQLSVSGSFFTSDPVEEGRPTVQYQFQLDGGVATLTRMDAEFDFTLQGQPAVAATQVIRLVRN